jgi:hypothetical protein
MKLDTDTVASIATVSAAIFIACVKAYERFVEHREHHHHTHNIEKDGSETTLPPQK